MMYKEKSGTILCYHKTKLNFVPNSDLISWNNQPKNIYKDITFIISLLTSEVLSFPFTTLYKRSLYMDNSVSIIQSNRMI